VDAVRAFQYRALRENRDLNCVVNVRIVKDPFISFVR
jgi:hypothetical protein